MNTEITIKLTRPLHDYNIGDIITLDRVVYKREFGTFGEEVKTEVKEPKKKIEKETKKEEFEAKVKKTVVSKKSKKVKLK